MANLKWMGAILAALFAMGLEASAGKGVFEICWDLQRKTKNLSPDDQADVEKVLAVAKNHIETLKGSEKRVGSKLNAALTTVVYDQDCEKSSLDVLKTMFTCYPQNKDGIATLTKATEEYARRCFPPNRIEELAKPRKESGGCLLTSCFNFEGLRELIDHQFFVDYKPEEHTMFGFEMIRDDSIEALVKAIIRDLKENVKDLKTENDVHCYLKERLYTPCSNYVKASKGVIGVLIDASYYFGGFRKLISALEENTQDDFYRYFICEESVSNNYRKDGSKKAWKLIQKQASKV